MARPDSKLTKSNIEELEKRFRDGSTILEAIDGIMAESTYHKHRSENTEFAARMDMAKEYVTEIARGVVAKRIKRGDAEVAKWWLERKNKKEFSTRAELTGADGKDLPTPILGGASVPSDDSDAQSTES